MKKKSFQTKNKSIKYPAETMTNIDYADDHVLLANTTNQDKYLLYSPEQEARHTGFSLNPNKS